MPLMRPKAIGAAILAVAAVLVISLSAAPARAQSDDASLRDRMARMEQEIANIRRLVARGATVRSGGAKPMAGQMPPTLAAQMEVRLGQLESEMRGMTGRIERIMHGLEQVQARIETLSLDIDFRLRALEQGRTGNAAGAKTGDPKANGTPTQPQTGSKTGPKSGQQGGTQQAALPDGKLPKGTPDEQYRYAKSFLRRARYSEAEAALKAFVAAYPDGPLTANAIYWLGETYFVRGDYAQAAVQFAAGYEKFPDHPKGPDNLLKLGMSLAKLDKKRDACATLMQLRRKYPKASGNIKRTAAAERKKLNCR